MVSRKDIEKQESELEKRISQSKTELVGLEEAKNLQGQKVERLQIAAEQDLQEIPLSDLIGDSLAMVEARNRLADAQRVLGELERRLRVSQIELRRDEMYLRAARVDVFDSQVCELEDQLSEALEKTLPLFEDLQGLRARIVEQSGHAKGNVFNRLESMIGEALKNYHEAKGGTPRRDLTFGYCGQKMRESADRTIALSLRGDV